VSCTLGSFDRLSDVMEVIAATANCCLGGCFVSMLTDQNELLCAQCDCWRTERTRPNIGLVV